MNFCGLTWKKKLESGLMSDIVSCGEASRSMAHKMSDGGGGVVVIFCRVGKFSKIIMREEEVWYGFVSWETLTKNELIMNHAPPQVYRVIALLL